MSRPIPDRPGSSSCGRRCRADRPTSPPRLGDDDRPAAVPARPLEPRTRLARAIAATIAGWLERGERLEPRGRALQAGDVMVLVRRRNEFVGDLLRALKQRGVPVAGADRLALADELAVQDLIALGRFLLLPEDDLTLATVLKGPLFGFSEDALFELAYDRGDDRLWTRLRRLARQLPAMREAYDRLRALLARADFVPPFELYAEILGTGPGTVRDVTGGARSSNGSGRRRRTRSRSSSRWRWPTSASTCPRCKAFCAGSRPATSRSSAISASASATRSAS